MFEVGYALPGNPIAHPLIGDAQSPGEFPLASVFRVTPRRTEERAVACTVFRSRGRSPCDSEFCKAYKKGLARTSNRIRAKQIKMAAAGVVPMSIWVGKNLLGQFDTPTANVMVAQTNGYPLRPGQLDLDPCSPVNRAKVLRLADLHRAIQDAALKVARE